MDEMKWIPCKDKMPEECDVYIISYKFGVVTLFWNGIGWLAGNRYIDSVTAWMPFPKPYKEQNELDQSVV